MDSGGSPENCKNNAKISKINHFGGPSGNCQKIVLGRLKVVKIFSKCASPDNYVTVFFTKYGLGLRPLPKAGRRPSAAAPFSGQYFRGPSGIHQDLHFSYLLQFSMDRWLIDCAGSGKCKARTSSLFESDIGAGYSKYQAFTLMFGLSRAIW